MLASSCYFETLMQKTIFGLFLIIMLWGCGQNTPQQASIDSANKPAATQSDTAATKQPDVVESSEATLTDKITMPEILLFGTAVSCTYSQIPERLKTLIPQLMQQISDKKAIMTGSYLIALQEEPTNDKAMKVFVGIPVQKPLKSGTFSTLTIPGNSYLRHQCKAEPGNALAVHQKILTTPFRKLRRKIGYPIIEKFAETRNEEMTSVISKATFYYPLP
jgi:hypothetical protein